MVYSGDDMLEQIREELSEDIRFVATALTPLFKQMMDPKQFRKAIDELFRVFHSIKSIAHYLNLSPMEEVCASAESVLEYARGQDAPVDENVVEWFGEVREQFEQWYRQLQESGGLYLDLAELGTDPRLRFPPIADEQMVEHQHAILKRLTVLYAEDEPRFRRRLGNFIARRVGKVYVAEDGIEGVELFRLYRPDIVITDVNMPNMHGFKMVEAIRLIAPDVPVVFLSAYDQPPFYEKSRRMRANSYLAKPFELERLDQELRQIGAMYFN